MKRDRNNALRVAIVGCGRISDLHALGYRWREDLCIVAVCDTNRGRAHRKAADWGVARVYTDYRKLLANENIHGYHLFSLARYLMGEVARVYAWIDRTPVVPTKYLDAPATIMFQFKATRRYGVMDIAHTPDMRIFSDYYADDNRMEVIGEKGILFINRCTAHSRSACSHALPRRQDHPHSHCSRRIASQFRR